MGLVVEGREIRLAWNLKKFQIGVAIIPDFVYESLPSSRFPPLIHHIDHLEQ